MGIRQKDGEHLPKTRNHIFMDVLYQGTLRNIIAMTVNMNGVGSKLKQKDV